MEKRNEIGPLYVIVAFCLLMFIAGHFFIEPSAGNEISPSFWPNLALYVVFIGSLIAIVQQIWAGDKFKLKMIVDVMVINKRQILFFLMGVLYVKFMEYIGFLVASLFMLPIMMIYFGYKNKFFGLLISFFFVLFIYFIFGKVFKISFPNWVLGV